MAINFGTAARNAASSIVNRRSNPDPDGVIASRVANSIIQNSTRDIGAFMQQARASMPAPRSFAPGVNPETGQRNPTAPPVRNPTADAFSRQTRNMARQAIVPPLDMDRPSMYGRRSAALPPGLEQLLTAGRYPAGLMGQSASGFGDDTIMGMIPYENVYDAGTADLKGPTVYEDGTMRRGIPAPLWPVGPQPGMIPAMPALVPGETEPMDPQLIMILRKLGLI